MDAENQILEAAQGAAKLLAATVGTECDLPYDKIEGLADFLTQIFVENYKLEADKKRLDFLQDLTNKKIYTGKVALRMSSGTRGWMLHETSNVDGVPDVRTAIDNFISKGNSPQLHIIN